MVVCTLDKAVLTVFVKDKVATSPQSKSRAVLKWIDEEDSGQAGNQSLMSVVRLGGVDAGVYLSQV